jgi:hypothetical protein
MMGEDDDGNSLDRRIFLDDPAVLHPARGVPQTGFTSGSFPQISISRSITNTRRYRNTEKRTR